MKTKSFTIQADATTVADEVAALDGPNTLVLAFATDGLDGSEPAWRALQKAFGRSKILGCSTAGAIGAGTLQERGIVVAVACFERTTLRLVSVALADASESFDAGRRLVDELVGEDLRGVYVLSDGRDVNGSKLTEGMCASAPTDVVITGGLAGDGDRFEETWIVVDGERRNKSVAGVGFYSDALELGHGYGSGWDGFGMRWRVTRSEGNVLYELDGRPALEVYKEYLGELAAGLPANALLFPLAMKAEGDEPVVRTVLAIDEAQQSMTFAGDIPEGVRVRLMRASLEGLIDGAMVAGQQTSERIIDVQGDSLSIAVSCVGRRLVLGERVEEEVESALDELPAGTTLVGFYSYGELSPHRAGPCQLHNQTMTLTTLFERAA
ncbi:MAG: FIST N-terminal domain-containing protein [Deltaproteobacteria bacterium]|jgi:hypothetical protein